MFKRKPVLFTVIFFCIVRLVLQLVADSNSGFQGDELLHIQTGHHPAWGYMEFPPVIGWLAYVQNLFGSTAVWVHHIFAHLASLGILILVAAIIVELGGGPKAVFIALLCVMAAPGFMRSQQLFQPVVFTQFFWVFSFYQLVRFSKTLRWKYLLYLTIILAIGFLTKYDIAFFIAGLSGLLLVKRTRTAIPFKQGSLLILLFFLLISPNILWQYQHDFPTVMHFKELYRAQLDKITLADFFSKLVAALNPFSLLVWLPGLIYLLRIKHKKDYDQPLALSVIISTVLLGLSKGKFYYFFPVLLTILCFGSVWLEQVILQKRKWVIYPFAGLLILSGIVLLPYGLAVLPLKAFIRYAKIKQDDGAYKIPYPEYFAPELWSNTMSAIKKVYDSLPANEKVACRIWGKHYRQAGAVNLYREAYQLPEALSYHGSFYSWAPVGEMPVTIIAFSNDSDSNIRFWQTYFSTVIPAESVPSKYTQDGTDKQKSQTIFICKDPKQNFDELKVLFSKRIFE